MSEGLKGIIPRTRELGRLRTGDSVPVLDRQTRKPVLHDDGSPKMRPARRATWRITSASRTLLEAAAELYGGTVAEWPDAPTPGQWELATECDSIEVLIPYDDSSLSQAFELWRAGGCERRCNGEVTDDGEACVCPADIEGRMAGAALRTPTACKPTTRLNVFLPDVPELGFFRLEAHGYHAASEIPGQLSLAQGLKVKFGDPNPWFTAWLRIDPRSGKKDGKTTPYTVPVVELPIKARSLMVDAAVTQPPAIEAGEAPAPGLSPSPAQVGSGSPTAAVAGVAQPEHPSPGSPPAAPPPDDAFDQFVSETWLKAFGDRCAEVGADAADVAEIVMAGTASRTEIPGQIRKDESAAVKRAVEHFAGYGYAPAEAEAAPV